LHLRDFGLAIFFAGIGLAAGPQAITLLMEEGLFLASLAVIVVLVPLICSMHYARYILKMHPVVICAALAGLLICTPALNAVVAGAGSKTPVLGYTVPYAITSVQQAIHPGISYTALIRCEPVLGWRHRYCE
jgi:AspT/YidE/YbjL antiporter-like protein